LTAETILYIVIAGVVSFALAVFMYGYKSKYTGKLRWLFGTLRFITLFAILLLLINPNFKSESYTIEKPKLSVLVDNSSSIKSLNQENELNIVIDAINTNEDIQAKFDVNFFSFGSDFAELDSLSFSEKNTNIAKALNTVQELFGNEIAPTVLISDGNQTLGTDYEFKGSLLKNPVYSVILGDSTKHTDLKIQQLNTNRYAFLKNQFPVEAILVYNGTGQVKSEFVISQGGSTVHRQNVSFSETDNTKTISLTLPAARVGLQKYTARLVPSEEEKNKTNNTKRFAVEVIDQATNVLIVSRLAHPDLGALQKAITSNEQRRFSVKKPADAVAAINDNQLVILYQPDRSFAGVFSEIKKLKKNSFVITGLHTDWNFLNSIQENYNKEVMGLSEDVSGALNRNYGTFALEDIGFDRFPPLKTLFGDLTVAVPHEVLLEQTIAGFSSESGMLTTMELNGKRDAIWDGEGIWKWRAQTYIATKSFVSFDEFIGKLVQYLASNKRRSRLEVSNETFYYNNNPIKVSAQYFDKNYVFDARASLSITVVNQETRLRSVFPMLLKNNFYEVNLNSLEAGAYNFTVSVEDEAVARSDNFTILDFNVEQQFLNADVTKLTRLATNSNGKVFFSTQHQNLLTSLIENEKYKAIQKSEQKVVPLIDWKYLLGIIVLALAAEWFIRKYNGHI
jgi:hypothetical protein